MLGRDQLDGAGLLQGRSQRLGGLVGCRPLEREAHAHAAVERGQFVGAQAFQQAAIAAQRDGQEDVAVEAGRSGEEVRDKRVECSVM